MNKYRCATCKADFTDDWTRCPICGSETISKITEITQLADVASVIEEKVEAQLERYKARLEAAIGIIIAFSRSVYLLNREQVVAMIEKEVNFKQEIIK